MAAIVLEVIICWATLEAECAFLRGGKLLLSNCVYLCLWSVLAIV